MSEPDEVDAVRRKAERMAAARRTRGAGWKDLAHVGVLGWMFVLPLMLGLWAGRALEAREILPHGTLVGLAVGGIIGGYAVWRQVNRSLGDDA